jgi:hypothetical protein
MLETRARLRRQTGEAHRILWQAAADRNRPGGIA